MGKSNKGSISFDQPIISTINNPISTKDLLARLHELHAELTSVDNIDTGLLKSIEADLVNKKLLRHSNTGVQALACCCLSDILRIHAPNAPFTETELTDIFKAFLRQFNKLSDQENPYYAQQEYLLKRVIEVRSIILITDLPESETLVEALFTNFYHLASGNFPKRLESLVSDMLSEIITELETIPHNVLKLILERFLYSSSSLIAKPDNGKTGLKPGDLNLDSLNSNSGDLISSKSNISNPGLNFSLKICESNIDRIQRLISQYFSESFYEFAKDLINPDDGGIVSSKTKNTMSTGLEGLKKIHKLAIQIWKYVPELLSSVISLIDDELHADNDKIRILATETIGKIIASQNIVSSTVISKVNFFIIHKECWINWLKMTTDISPAVRIKWVEQYSQIIKIANTATSEVSNQLNKCFYKCLIDSNDNVRSMACKSLEEIPFEIFTNRVCNVEILKGLTQCTREKNPLIRNQAIKTLGSIYNNYQKAIEAGNVLDFGVNDEEQSAIFSEKISSGIPNDLLSLYYINDKLINVVVDTTIYEALLPINESSTTKRVSRLVQFYGSLNQKAKDSFIALNKRQIQNSKVIQTFVATAEEYNNLGSLVDNKENVQSEKSSEKQILVAKLEKIIQWLADPFPEDWNSYSYIDRFSKLKNNRFLYLLKTCVSVDSDYNTVKNSIKELLKKLSDPKNIAIENDHTSITSGTMVTNFKLLLIRSSSLVFNKSNIMELISYAKDIEHEWNDAANDLLEVISQAIPDVFKAHVTELTDLLVKEESDNNKQRPYTLTTIYHFIKKFPEMFPSNPKFIEVLKDVAINGTPREAKYAVKILGYSDSKESSCKHIFSEIYPFDLDSVKFSTHLSVVAELFLIAPFILEEVVAEITGLLIKEVFLKNRHIEDSVKESKDWIVEKVLEEQHELHSTLYEKLLALRILVNRLKSLETTSGNDVEEMKSSAEPIFKLLVSLIGNGGEIINNSSPSWPTPEVYKLKIRLVAGQYLLKIAKIGAYSELIRPTTIRRLTFLLTDSDENVRGQFLVNLHAKLVHKEVSERFIPIVFYSAFESNSEIKKNAKMWINTLIKRQDSAILTFEKSLVRLIHILTHDDYILNLTEEFDSSDSTIVQNYIQAYSYAIRVIVFYLDLVANSDNISLLYYLASRVKQHRDAIIESNRYENDSSSKEILNLYRISELTQLIIREHSEHKTWTLQTWMGKIKLPTDIYAPMNSLSEAQKVITTVFIPEIIQDELTGLIKKRILGASVTKKLNVAQSNSTTKKVNQVKRKRSTTTNASTKKQKNGKKVSEYTGPARKSTRAKSAVKYDEDQSDSDNASESEFESDISD